MPTLHLGMYSNRLLLSGWQLILVNHNKQTYNDTVFCTISTFSNQHEYVASNEYVLLRKPNSFMWAGVRYWKTCYLEHAKTWKICTYSFAFHFSCDCHIISLREVETSIVRCTEDPLLLRMIRSSYCTLETIRHVPPYVANHSCCGEWRMLHATDDVHVRVQTTDMGTISWMNAETLKRLPSYTPLFGKQVKCTLM